MSKGVAKTVREFFVRKKRFANDIALLSEELGIKREYLRYTVRDFLRRGELRVESNELVYQESNRKDFLLDKVWRAWRYHPVWTISEIAAVTHANKETITSYVKLYMKAGYVEKVGKKNVHGRMQNLYRLKDRSIRFRPQILNQRELKGVKNEGDKK